jgi:hypothetical protein
MPSAASMRRLGRKRFAVPSPIPITSGLIHQCDSYDFDRNVAGSTISVWRDKSGGGRHWIAGSGTINITSSVGIQPASLATVDQTIKANGHCTVNFAGSPTPQWFEIPNFFGASGFLGLEVMCVFRRFTDPPPDNQNAGGPFQFVHPLSNFPSHEPFTDSSVYEGFARTTRPADGNPATSLSSAFRLYNVAAASTNDAYDIWVDTENLTHLTGGYTFSQQGAENTFFNALSLKYYLGVGTDYGGTVYMYRGNIACCYVWNRRLSTTERATMRTYINAIYGTAA